jgi:hypothetical protein
MDYEKAYKEALERAKADYTRADTNHGLLEFLFPELKESEDKKTRKEIKDFFSRIMLGQENFLREDYDWNAWIAWLEKQGEQKCTAEEVLIKAGLKPYKDGDQWCILLGDNIQEGICGFGDTIDDALYAFLNDLIKSQKEQKSVDKVEQKFHEGDWIVYKNDICQIVKREKGCNKLVTVFGIEKELVNERNLSTARPWTIQDAKDGDVIVSGETIILVSNSAHAIDSACAYIGEEDIFVDYKQVGYNGDTWHPADQKERDLLFQKMNEAGYEWDAEKKELKKIEQKPAWSEEDKQYLLVCKNALAKYQVSDHWDAMIISKWLEEKVKSSVLQPKQEWSEEDENNLNSCISKLEIDMQHWEGHGKTMVDGDRKLISWLKSLRPQSNVSDEELAQAKKDAYNDALDKIEYHSGEPTFDDGWSAAIDFIRKKSLSPQNRWKPSEEQMKALKSYIDRHPLCEHIDILVELYNDLHDLKKL